jgi:hypothetical protein
MIQLPFESVLLLHLNYMPFPNCEPIRLANHASKRVSPSIIATNEPTLFCAENISAAI